MSEASDESINAALQQWCEQALVAFRAGESPQVAYASPALPTHAAQMVNDKLAKATSVWAINKLFKEVEWVAHYPPGFESNHPTNLFYRGLGIAATDHPQQGTFDFNCPKCKTDAHVLVLSSEWRVSIMSGDARGIFKAKCQRCGKKFAGGFED